MSGTKCRPGSRDASINFIEERNYLSPSATDLGLLLHFDRLTSIMKILVYLNIMKQKQTKPTLFSHTCRCSVLGREQLEPRIPFSKKGSDSIVLEPGSYPWPKPWPTWADRGRKG
jgi:hypothetical protein